nr:hypothetical protein [uncultured Cellulosilyticum sp.]
MEDLRCLDNNFWWLIIIAVFVLCFCNNGCNNNLGCLFNGLFDGCGNNTWIWIIIAVIIYMCFCNTGCGSIFRNDIQ